MAHSLKEGKLKTYLKIKTNFGYENYLSIIKNFEQRRRLSKLRIFRCQICSKNFPMVCMASTMK
jgi:hypothetical protein